MGRSHEHFLCGNVMSNGNLLEGEKGAGAQEGPSSKHAEAGGLELARSGLYHVLKEIRSHDLHRQSCLQVRREGLVRSAELVCLSVAPSLPPPCPSQVLGSDQR